MDITLHASIVVVAFLLTVLFAAAVVYKALEKVFAVRRRKNILKKYREKKHRLQEERRKYEVFFGDTDNGLAIVNRRNVGGSSAPKDRNTGTKLP